MELSIEEIEAIWEQRTVDITFRYLTLSLLGVWFFAGLAYLVTWCSLSMLLGSLPALCSFTLYVMITRGVLKKHRAIAPGVQSQYGSVVTLLVAGFYGLLMLLLGTEFVFMAIALAQHQSDWLGAATTYVTIVGYLVASIGVPVMSPYFARMGTFQGFYAQPGLHKWKVSPKQMILAIVILLIVPALRPIVGVVAASWPVIVFGLTSVAAGWVWLYEFLILTRMQINRVLEKQQ